MGTFKNIKYKIRSRVSDIHGWHLAGLLSLIFSICMCFGRQLDTTENVDFRNGRMWLFIVGMAVVVTVGVHILWHLLRYFENRINRLRTLKKEKDIIENNTEENAFLRIIRWCRVHSSVTTFLVLLICWLPILLGVYPGFFVYDAQDEVLQVITRQFTTHHPLSHELLLGGILQAFHKLTGSYNLGIFVYTLCQAILCSAGFTYILHFLKKKGANIIFRLVMLLYYAFFPVIDMFVLCSAKDTIFALALSLMLTALYEMSNNREGFFKDIKSLLLFAASSVVMLLFRRNGLYAFLLVALIMLIAYRKYFVKLLLTFAVILACFWGIDHSLTQMTGADTSESREYMTVIIQQLARTYKYSPEMFTDEDGETLYEILDEDTLKLYRAKLSDPVKAGFNDKAFNENPSKYLELWFRIGLKKPFSYINAWLMTSYGYWYPDTVVDVYSGNTVFTYTYEDCSYFGYEVEEPGFRDSKIPAIDEYFRRLSLEVNFEKIPVVNWFFAPGGIFWITCFMFGYLLYRKNNTGRLPYIMLFAVWLTFLLGPTFLPRYVVFFWFALPVTVYIPFIRNKQEQ